MKENILDTFHETLLRYFGRLIPLDAREQELITQKFQSRLFRKRQYVLQEGNLCMHMYFVVRGCLRMYMIDDKGVTHIIQFAAENYWIVDIGSFHNERPSKLNIDALEDTVVLQINLADLIRLYLDA